MRWIRALKTRYLIAVCAAALVAVGMAPVASSSPSGLTVRTVPRRANFVAAAPVAALQVLPTVSVTATDPSASEQGSHNGTFRVARTAGTGPPLTVNYTLTGSTAVSGIDYATLSGSVVINSGIETVDVTVDPIEDSAVEGDETVILTVSSGNDYTVGSPASATVTIVDNDPPVVTVTAFDPNASEPGADTGTFTISRTGPMASPLTVFYTVGGSATSGTDYAALTGSAIIAAASSNVTVLVTPVNDTVSESSETVLLTLLANAGYAIGSPNAATVNIADDEPVVTIHATDDTATEAGTSPGVFTITRTGPLTAALTVNFTVTGTAANGTDYTSIPIVAVIASGQASTTVTVNPIDDALVESTETVIVTLQAGAYTIGARSSDSVQITDNDGTTLPLGMPATKDQCKKGGWQNFGVFKNQGDCVSWVATGHRNPPAGG
jgi:hypothetical protein